LLATAVVMSALAVLPMLSWWAGFEHLEQKLLIAAFAIACAAGAALGVHRGLRPVILLYSVFQYCWLVVPASYQISHGVAAWGDSTVTDQVGATSTALLLCLVAQVVLLAGYVVTRRRGPGSRDPWRLSTQQAARFARLSALLLVVATLLLPVVLTIVGGVGPLFSNRAQLNETLTAVGVQPDNTGTSAIVKIIPGAFAVSGTLLALAALRLLDRRQQPALRRRFLWQLVWGLALLAVFANPFAYTRFTFLAAFGSVFLMALLPRSRSSAVLVLVAALVAFLFAYPAGNYFKVGQSRDVSTAQKMFTSSDFDGFQQAINTVTLVHDEGHADGVHVASAALFFVPRAIWPGKATPASFEVARHRGYSFQNLSLPFPAELYLDLTWVGMVLVMAGVGFVWRALDDAWVFRRPAIVVTAFVAMAQIGLTRGPLGSLVPVFGIALVLLSYSIWRSKSLAPGEPDTSQLIAPVDTEP
jgi:hypothetical protein